MLVIPYKDYTLRKNFWKRLIWQGTKRRIYLASLLAYGFMGLTSLSSGGTHSSPTTDRIVLASLGLLLVVPVLLKLYKGGADEIARQSMIAQHIPETHFQTELSETPAHKLFYWPDHPDLFTVLLTKNFIVNLPYLGADVQSAVRLDTIGSIEYAEGDSKRPYKCRVRFHMKDGSVVNFTVERGLWLSLPEEEIASLLKARKALLTQISITIPHVEIKHAEEW
ncbi:MAG: hypothetical protein JSS75_04135 [Bacteroidetes bacterium]|nr:hypothetical protein [Bacteroidota bacterium]